MIQLDIDRCFVCKKRFIPKNYVQKYCSRKCNDKAYYRRHTERIRARVKIWKFKNKEKVDDYQKNTILSKRQKARLCELAKKNYQENKHKWVVRRKAFGFRKRILDFFDNSCVFCKSNTRLQIHHLDYGSENENFKDVLKRVIVLCIKCHKKLHSKI